MGTLQIALLQMFAVESDQDANRDKGETFCRRAAEKGADIALFPEMWNIGYIGPDSSKPNGVEEWQRQAISVDSPFVEHFRALARELNIAIGITYLQKWDGPPRNAISLIDRHGEIILTYAKVHTCDFFPMEASCTPGHDFYVESLDTAAGPVDVGAMICYDREFPESARTLMLKGAEIILTPNACGLQSLRISQFRSRAFENAVGVAMTNYAAPQINGHSVAFAADGEPILEAGEDEDILMAAYDMDALHAYRAKTVWGNAFRRPHRYGLLPEMETKEPFIRNDAFGEPFKRGAR